MATKYYKEESRKNWFTTSENLPNEQLQTGAILRIADASEAMAKNHNQLLADLEMYKRWYNREVEKNKTLTRSNNALKGHINRLKKLS